MQYAIRLNGIEKRFGEVRALEGITYAGKYTLADG